MVEQRELVVIGAGAAGLSAAVTAQRLGIDVLVLDEQETPGGQIYRSIEAPGVGPIERLGEDYARGADLAGDLRASEVDYRPCAAVWEASRERALHVSGPSGMQVIEARTLILATGAIERPFPIPGWCLPGVMTAGGAQILLKSAGIVPDGPVVIAGTGPLVFLVAWQLVQTGVRLEALLETTPRANLLKALPFLPSALRAGGFIGKGLRWLRDLHRAGVWHVRGVRGLRAVGGAQLEAVEYESRNATRRIETRLLLLHQGVVPNINLTMVMGCRHQWDRSQLCLRPVADVWGRTDIPEVSVAGDGAGIMGAVAAESSGRLAAYDLAHRLGRIDRKERDRRAAPVLLALERALRVRPFLDTAYRPIEAHRIPPRNDTVVCRCEEVTAGAVREEIAKGASDPNQIKSKLRCGMGPCQGRYCGLTVCELIADARGCSPEQVGYYRLRPPIKPVPIGDLLAFDTDVAPPEVALPDPTARPESPP